MHNCHMKIIYVYYEQLTTLCEYAKLPKYNDNLNWTDVYLFTHHHSKIFHPYTISNLKVISAMACI